MKMKDNKTWLGVIVAVIVIIVIIGAFMLTRDSENGNDNDIFEEGKVTINGKEYAQKSLFEDFQATTRQGSDGKSYEGVLLSSLIEDSGVSNPSDYHYVLTAGDGYAIVVNWTSMQNGILVEVEEEEDSNVITYLMTYFPDLPKSYRVKYLADIELKMFTPVIINEFEYHLDYMPKKIEKKTVPYNETANVEGFSLSDMINYTGLQNPESYQYIINASDYEKTVSWADMETGVLVKEDVRAAFPYLSKKYWVRDVIRIEVV